MEYNKLTNKSISTFLSDLSSSYKYVAIDTETYVQVKYKNLIKDDSVNLHPQVSKVRLIQIGLCDEVEKVTDETGLFNNWEQVNFRCWVLDTHGSSLETISRVLDALKNKIIVGHNLKFDVKMLEYHYGHKQPRDKLFCTLVGSQLIGHATGSTSVGTMNRSLKDLVSDWLSRAGDELALDKTEQLSDWSSKLTNSQIEYAVSDTKFVLPIALHIIETCNQLGMVSDLRLEQRVLPAVARMELNGLGFNRELYERIMKLAVIEIGELKVKACRILGIPLQKAGRLGSLDRDDTYFVSIDEKILSSPVRLRKILEEKGITIPDTQTTTLRQVTEILSNRVVDLTHEPVEDELDSEEIVFEGLSDDLSLELVQTLVDIKALKKLVNDKYDRFINPATAKVHPSFDQGRAQTGRFGCRKPNLQSISKGGILDKSNNTYYLLRQIFMPDGECVVEGGVSYWSGKVYCAKDIDRQELVVAAYLSKDITLKNALERGEDLHTTHALMAWPELTEADVRQKSKKLGNKKPRDLAKNIIFGVLYGQDPLVMAASMGLSQTEGKELHNRLKARYPQLFEWLEDKKEFGINHKWVAFTNDGPVRRIRFLAGNAAGNGDDNTLGRLAMNAPIQGVSSSQAKNILLQVDEFLEDNNLQQQIGLHGQIHDEFIVSFTGRLYEACSIGDYIDSSKSGKEPRPDQYIEYIPDIDALPDGTNPVDKIDEIMSDAGTSIVEGFTKVNTGNAFAPYWAKG